jgi:hypothetical protein
MVVNELEVELRPESVEAAIVDLDAGFEELKLKAKDDDPNVDELFALDARDDANDCVVK